MLISLQGLNIDLCVGVADRPTCKDVGDFR